VFVRVTPHGARAAAARLTARLLDRRGASLVVLPLSAPGPGGGHQLELPLTSIAPGEFVIAFEASAGEARAEAFLPFRVVR
jgi:hypothetical protein